MFFFFHSPNDLKDGKSPGCDNIQAEMIKASGEGLDVYHRLCTKIWETGQWPNDCRRAIFIPLPKKGEFTAVLLLQNNIFDQSCKQNFA